MKHRAALVGKNQQGEVGAGWRKGRADPSPKGAVPIPRTMARQHYSLHGPRHQPLPTFPCWAEDPIFQIPTLFFHPENLFHNRDQPWPWESSGGQVVTHTLNGWGLCLLHPHRPFESLPQARITRKPCYAAAYSAPHSFLFVFGWLYPLPSPLLSPLHLSSLFFHEMLCT